MVLISHKPNHLGIHEIATTSLVIKHYRKSIGKPYAVTIVE